jgi:hypothetical protein
MKLNQDNASTALEGNAETPLKSTKSAPKSRRSQLNKKSSSKRASNQGANTPQTKSKSASRKSAPPAPMGRPRLSDQEREARRLKREDVKVITSLVKAQSSATGKEKPRNSAPVSSLGVAQRALGIGFGEADGEVEDAPVITRSRLPENVRRFLLLRNACSVPTRNIIKEAQQVFGLSLSTAHIAHYDPSKIAGATLRDEYKRLFAEMRHEYNAAIGRISLGDQAFRVANLHNLATKAIDSGAAKLAASLMDQIAKEKCEGHYAKPPKESEDKRALLARLVGCDVSQLPPIPPKKEAPSALPCAAAESGGVPEHSSTAVEQVHRNALMK